MKTATMTKEHNRAQRKVRRRSKISLCFTPFRLHLQFKNVSEQGEKCASCDDDNDNVCALDMAWIWDFRQPPWFIEATKKRAKIQISSFSFFSLSHSENATIPEDPRRFELPTRPSRTTRSLMANASVCQRSCRTDAVSAATQRPADNSWRTLGRLQRAAKLLHSQSCYRAESMLIKARRLEHKDEAYANGDRWTSQSSRANRRQSIERIIGGS